MSDDELLTVAEVAARLKVNEQTVRNWIDREELPAVRVGARRVRIAESALEAFTAHKASPRPSHAERPVTSEIEREAMAHALEKIAEGVNDLAKAVRGR